MRQLGRDAVIEEALRDHLTGWYSRAVAVAGIDPVERPTIDWSDEPVEGTPFSFTAEVEVKPAPTVKATRGSRASGNRPTCRPRRSTPRSSACASPSQS